jgi:hypothetical protein
MRRWLMDTVVVFSLIALVFATTEGVSDAKGPAKDTPVLDSSLNSNIGPVGYPVLDTATLVGKAKVGSPTGTVSFFACGPTATATPCISPHSGPDAVPVTVGAHHRSTATAQITPTSSGWYCFLDKYSGDAHYTRVRDSDTATGCIEATGSVVGPNTPTVTSVLNSPTLVLGGQAEDTVTVQGKVPWGSPTGTLTFSLCGPTSEAEPCPGSPSGVSSTETLAAESGNRATTALVIGPDKPGWYCLLDQYNGDTNYTPAADNDPATECFRATNKT